MKLKRAIGFGLLLYIVSSIVFYLVALTFGIELQTETYSVTLSQYLGIWILYIPVTLLLAKWYFKKVEPTAKSGFQLGIVVILVAFAFDAISIAVTLIAKQPIDIFVALYSDWKFWVSIVIVIALTTFAGWEFDGTFSKPADKPPEIKK